MPVPRFYHYLGLSLQPAKNAIQLPDTVQPYQLRADEPLPAPTHQPDARAFRWPPTLSRRNKGGCTSPRSVRQRPVTARARSCGARLHREGANLRTGGAHSSCWATIARACRSANKSGSASIKESKARGKHGTQANDSAKRNRPAAFASYPTSSPQRKAPEVHDRWDNAAGGLGDDVEGRSESAADASIDQTTDPQVFAAQPIDTGVESVKKAETTPSTSERFRICVRPARLSSKKHWDSLVPKAG
ncbi:hypothetical protein B0H10DRAFT_1947022 [Mycena sp. CBHHK59/15]|nr:hypothetical protein B0H10DRAFT_1947022 [Mycena sp. CBHHK59/15]